MEMSTYLVQMEIPSELIDEVCLWKYEYDATHEESFQARRDQTMLVVCYIKV